MPTIVKYEHLDQWDRAYCGWLFTPPFTKIEKERKKKKNNLAVCSDFMRYL